MFSEEDVKEIIRLFPPPRDSELLPSVIPSSGGHGLITLEFTQTQFRSRVTQEPARISVDQLAVDLDVDVATIRQLVRTHSALALLSADKNRIVTTDCRKTLFQKISNQLLGGITQRSDFAAENDIDEHSVNALLADIEGEIVESDGYLFRAAYQQTVSERISELLRQSLSSLSAVDFVSQELPGAPPTWFTHRVLREVLDSGNLADAYFVKESAKGASCYPKQLIEKNRDAIINDLQSGELLYLDLESFQAEFAEFYATVEEAARHVGSAATVDIIDAIAISIAGKRIIGNDLMQSLRKDGFLDMTNLIGEIPERLQKRIAHDIESEIFGSYESETGTQLCCVGDWVVQPEIYDREQSVLLDYAEADANSQWQQLRENIARDVSFSLASITGRIAPDQPVLGALSKERATEKVMEERFWATISRQEAENEAHFSQFWSERVQSRLQLYTDGLLAIHDQKLREQLSEVLAMHAKKELIPESIAKARSQALVLSRRTQKNLVAKELVDKKDGTIAEILAVLKKLNKKQGIEPLEGEKVQAAKQSTMSDMIRRMQKQKKSDGPVLFLTLVLILVAKHYSGIVYATGKFAPKLLKQLQSVLPAEQYEQLERWKEAAKTSSLTAEDRAAMKLMAEACD